jgi:hypothetical protein
MTDLNREQIYLVDLAREAFLAHDDTDHILGTKATRGKAQKELAAILCGMTASMIHECFVFANRRKIFGKLLIEYQLAAAKLADLAMHEAVTDLRFQQLVLEQTAGIEVFREICRTTLRVSAIRMEFMAGEAFVQENGKLSRYETVLAIVAGLLAEIENAAER